MKKIVAVSMLVLLGSTFVAAAPGFAGTKIANSQLIQATQDTTVNFAGSKVFVPKGQTIILGQRSNGAIVIRGRNLQGVKLDNAAISTQGNTVVSYYPSSNVAFLNRGETMTITDALGRTATVDQSGAIATNDAAVNSNTVEAIQEQAKAEAAQAAAELGDVTELPAFVASTETSSAASEQASQNVEETEKTLSPSAPR